jgi:hypothetical protein
MVESAGECHDAAADRQRGPFGFPRVDRFAEWVQAPVPLESTHPRFDIRRARPEEFDRIYDLIDESFGVRRPRALYDWLYRHNPYGLARCWVVVDRASNRFVANAAAWPWPMAEGAQRVEGTLGGDWAIAPAWRRQGISVLRVQVWDGHPWRGKLTGLSWPNEKSRGSAAKRGRGARFVGPVPRVVLPLNVERYLAARRWSPHFAAVGGAVVDGALEMWRSLRLPRQTGLVIEPVRRFDSSFDSVTQRCMAWHGFWSPHEADFLNWRYVDHPSCRYIAFSVTAGAELAGYYVLKIDGPAAWLMEFAAPTTPRGLGGTVLRHVAKTAREAGCAYLRFSAPPRWRHWKLFHAAGFVPTSSETYVWPSGKEPEVRQLDLWQWVPGDMDDL